MNEGFEVGEVVRYYDFHDIAICTRDDHDTLDPFCGGCGEQLHEAEPCDVCSSGKHDGPSPYCPCCGIKLS